MTSVPYCILLLFYLHHQVQSASSVETATSEEKKKRSPAIIEKQPGKTDGGSSIIGPRDCSDIRAMNFTTSGVYRLYAGDDRKRVQADVYCDFNSSKESWLVFQRRKDGSETFERNYKQYENGFGNLSGEFWLGNELIHLITTNRKYKLRIDLEDFEGQKRYAEYSTFVVDSAAEFYRLTVSGYSGNAGDSLAHHNNSRFTTLDMDNDIYKPANCAKLYNGGWWYSDCHRSSLNSLYLGGKHASYGDGIEWYTWHGLNYSLKKTEMKLMRLEEKAV